MIKKISFLCFILIFLNNCGYTPIYSKKSQNFNINEINTFGKKNANKILINKLKIYKNNPDANKSFNILINSKSSKTTISKDKKGNPTQFSMALDIDIKITDNFNNEIKKTFSENSTYDNSENKFDLRKYEDNLIKNMSETIFSEIILLLQTNS
mgnify:FL=1|tara:strand:+ start:270 stop:731 length:462 start_codon:yes stop_codon:yes gene_type:complete